MTEHIQINDVQPRIHYVADGVQSAFSFPFAIFRDTDLEVWLDDVKQTSGYSVSGAGITTGGTAILAAPPAPGVGVTLRRRLALARTTDYQADGLIRAKTLNDELDFQVAAVQQVAEELGRAVKRSPTSPSTADLTLPEPAPRRAIRWNDSGTALVNTTTDPEAVGDAAQAAAEATAARDVAVTARDEAVAAVGSVKVSANDALAGPLAVKLVAGEGITLTESADGGDERLTVATTLSASVLDRLAFLETNLAINTLRDQIDAGWSVLKMVDGWADEFEDETGILQGHGANLIPAMTSNTAPSGTVTASSEYGGDSYAPYRAFDGTNTSWFTANGQPTGWIAYDFGTPTLVTRYSVRSQGNTEAPRNWTFEGWDGANWVVLHTVTNAANPVYTDTVYDFTNQTAYSKYRLNVSANYGAALLHVSELKMFGPLPGASSGQVYDAASDCYANYSSGTAGGAAGRTQTGAVGLNSGVGSIGGMKFTASASGTVAEVTVSVSSVLVSDTYTASIYTDSAGTPGSLVGSASSGQVIGSSGVKTFTWSSGAPTISSGTVYWVILAPAGGGDIELGMCNAVAGITSSRANSIGGIGAEINVGYDWIWGVTVSSSGAMTLVSNAVLAASSAPSDVRLVLLHEPVDAVTLNTDLIAEVSRDDGATWTAVTLAAEGAFDATTTILSGAADLSAQPTGTAMRWRVRTLNNKFQRLHGVWIQWR